MRRKLAWTDKAWTEYAYWQFEERKSLKRINRIIEQCLRHPFEGIGKPEALGKNLSGFWSRRISNEHRLVYAVDDDFITIISCRFHYEKQ